MSVPVQDAGALHRRIFGRILLTAIPSAVVAGYVIGPILGLGGDMYGDSLPVLVAAGIAVASAVQWFASRALVRAAVATRGGDAPGARLARLLELPRRIEIYSNTSGWLTGGLVFGVLAVFRHGVPHTTAVSAAGLALFSSLFPGLVLVMLVEDVVRPAALEEAGRGARAPRRGGMLWPRQRWYLPYAFAVALVSLLVFSALVLVQRYRAAVSVLVSEAGAREGALAAEMLRERLEAQASATATPLATIVLVLLVAFGVTGALLARRQARAAAAVEASLRSMAAGVPEAPAWVSTDEVGDLATATGDVAGEMRRAFDQLRAMAAGDLGRELEGESGLVTAFRASRDGMLELAGRMAALSRGEVVESGRVPGDLGSAFERLRASIGATVVQARTIAEGDLRRDVDAPGELGQAIQRMTGNLRRMVGRTQSVSGDMGQIVVSLQSAAAQLSAATTEQVAAVTETANTMTEMAQTSAVSADRASELIRQGEAAAAVVEEGTASADSVSHAMVDMTAALDEVGQASGALAERVRKIDGITETVTFLADQSSTLAINAAIEAARAGDAGKGFSVVAREIRTLAADSRKAAGQIKDILGEIRERSARVDGTVASGSRKATDVARLVLRVGEVISQLGVTLHDAVGLMRQVEGSARQHQAGVGQVSAALTNLRSASESIRDGARLLGELSGKARELSSSLQSETGTYRLPEARA